MRVKQRQDAGEVIELLEELHFLHEASVRLVLGRGRVDKLEGDDSPILMRHARPPDSRVPADAELSCSVQGSIESPLVAVTSAYPASRTLEVQGAPGIHSYGMIGLRRWSCGA
jgi:hypothetical protein